jgi:HEAT repeat protein
LRLKVKGNLVEKTAYCPGCGQELSNLVCQSGDAVPSEEEERPSRSWAAVVFAVVALVVGAAAMPVGVAFDRPIAPVLAGVGLSLGMLGMFTAVLRCGGRGFGLSLASSAVCGLVLVVALMFFGKGTPPDDRGAIAEAANQADDGHVDAGKPANPPKPGPGHDPAGGISDPKIAKLVRELRSDRPANRIRAAEELSRMKEKARPAARAICEAATDTDESVRQAALEALEKVQPALYEPVLTLMVDGGRNNQARAARIIEQMGEDGKPATPVLLAHLRLHPAVADIKALRVVASDDPATAVLLLELMTYGGQRPSDEGWQIRNAATAALRDVAKSQPSQRREIVKSLVAAIRNAQTTAEGASGRHPLHIEDIVAAEQSFQTAIVAINTLAEIGPDAKEAVPELKKLKLSPSASMRRAAIAALERIDPQR